ncbi:MAG TPA: hypothetical protein VM598_06705 [Bdellovibrionota bacterium]|nr:hypothetical protein [Bdellovibrionota bacterium]
MALKEKHRPLGKSLSEALGRAGIDVIRIADSKKNGFFQNWREACWVETNLGILDVIFFPEGAGGKRLRIERLEAEYGLARSRVISPDGQTVTVQGLETHDFTGPRTWISTASKELAEALNRVRDFP